MSELRQDPVTGDWVIINPQRAARPHDGAASGPCPFCPGNEGLTPPPTDVIPAPGGGWLVRSFANRFPVLTVDAADVNVTRACRPEGWHCMPGRGMHEVIVEAPEHGATLSTLGVEHVRQVLEMYLRRFRALAAAGESVRQIVLFRNQGKRAGTSLFHPHSQIVAVPVVAPETRRRLEREAVFFEANGRCGVCDTLDRELEAAERIVHTDPHFVTLTPFASCVPFHFRVIPRRHCPAFPEIEAAELDGLAVHLRAALRALHEVPGSPDFNLVVVTPPLEEVHRRANHWFIDVLPRLTTPAGFELGSRIVVNVQTPEQAAAELRARWNIEEMQQ